MPSLDAFSFSRMTTFEQCARRYRYRYLDGVREGFQSIEAFMGQQVHACVEWLYKERMAGGAPRVEVAIERYCHQFDRELAGHRPAIKVIRRDATVEHYRRSGAEMLADFHRQRFIVDGLETIATERHFVLELAEGLRFQGFIDRVARDGSGRLHLIDFKTGSRVPERFEGKDADQLDAYALAMFTEQPELDEIVLVLEYLRTARAHTKRIRRRDSAAIHTRLTTRIGVALLATVFPPSPGALCDWCGFNDLCEAYAGMPSRRLYAAGR
ncbi:MAG TPA: PD-(D/E)XK nuclease family protein [Candidatus Binatia bacterium]|nr:PD-(D/E)XK nuclease family protein [Candidatus Binatia bacterium]